MDNRDIPVKIEERTRYYPHTKSTVKAFVKEFPNRELKVLDIGARDGYAVELLAKKGYKVLGTELVKKFVEFAQKKGRDVIFDDAMDTKITKKFDVIYSRHCLEHCRDTLQFFETCKKLLNNKGSVFITFHLETKKQFYARKFPGLQHMVYYKNKDAFRKITEETNFKEVYFGKAKRMGIIPDRKEMLFVGRLK